QPPDKFTSSRRGSSSTNINCPYGTSAQEIPQRVKLCFKSLEVIGQYSGFREDNTGKTAVVAE
ncbi:hypothetical protein KJ865_07825, partial [Myxococcota bacterium]|nr:hypothetical protein [Myxococcota bacterium]